MAIHCRRDDLRSSILQHLLEVGEGDPLLAEFDSSLGGGVSLLLLLSLLDLFDFGRPRFTLDADTWNSVSLLLESSNTSLDARSGETVCETSSVGLFSLGGDGS